MFTRRTFLESSGMLAASTLALCRPALSSELPKVSRQTSADAVQRRYVKDRQAFYTEHDPKMFLGYPGNYNPIPQGFLDWREELRTVGVGEMLTTNVGDPFHKAAPYSTHPLEADVVRRFGARYGFPQDDLWGFVTNSGTDSNMHGAYIGRTLLKERTGVLPKIYYTEEAHYSIQIIRDLLGLEEVLIDTNADSGMDMEDLEAKLEQHRDAPVLLVATIGTTFKGGIDDIDAIQSRLKGKEAYVHLDAALFGGYLHASPFADEISRGGLDKKRYDSISVSCHKFFGFPSAAGLFLCGDKDFNEYRDYFEQVHDPAYISHVPGTITCSRDAVKPAEFHYFCTDPALARQQADAKLVLDNAAYLQQQMQSHFQDLNPVLANSRSNTVYFDNAVSAELKKKWVLATIKGTEEDGKSLAHVVVMPHASRALLDQFLNDLERDQKGS